MHFADQNPMQPPDLSPQPLGPLSGGRGARTARAPQQMTAQNQLLRPGLTSPMAPPTTPVATPSANPRTAEITRRYAAPLASIAPNPLSMGAQAGSNDIVHRQPMGQAQPTGNFLAPHGTAYGPPAVQPLAMNRAPAQPIAQPQMPMRQQPGLGAGLGTREADVAQMFDQGRMQARANAAQPNLQRNPMVPFNPGQPGFADAVGQHGAWVRENGLPSDQQAHDMMRARGFMPNVTTGGLYGQPNHNGYDGAQSMHEAARAREEAITQAGLQREAANGMSFNDPVNLGGAQMAPRVNNDQGLWYNQPRQQTNQLANAQQVAAGTAGRPMAMGGQVTATADGGLRGNPLNDVNSARLEVGMNPLAANPMAQRSDKSQALLNSRDAMTRARGIERGNRRVERMGGTGVGPMDDPVTAMNVMQQQMDQPLQLQQMRNQGLLDNTNAAGAWNFAGVNDTNNANYGIQGLRGTQAMDITGANNQHAMGMQQSQQTFQGEQNRMALEAAGRQAALQAQQAQQDAIFQGQSGIINSGVQSGAMTPMQGLNTLGSLRQPQSNGLSPASNAGLGAAAPPMNPFSGQGPMRPGAGGANGPVDPSTPYAGGRLSQQQYDHIDSLIANGDHNAALAAAQANGVSEDEFRKMLVKNRSMFEYMFGTVDPTYRGQRRYINPDGTPYANPMYTPSAGANDQGGGGAYGGM